jgi:hypothetical protein
MHFGLDRYSHQLALALIGVMMRTTLTVAMVLLSSFSADGCSGSPPDVAVSAPEAHVAATSSDRTQFDPSTLKEVRRLADLPVGVQVLANSSYMRENFDYTPTKFLVGGLGGTSAIVAYEQGGYVPSYHAQSYVFRNSRWVPDKKWRLESRITDLTGIVAATVSGP